MTKITETLEVLAKRSLSEIGDAGLSNELNFEITKFNRNYQKRISELKQCENVSKNIVDIVAAVVPVGQKLAKDTWGAFETWGLWTPQTKEISDILTRTLTLDNFISGAVGTILEGCECKKPMKGEK